MQKHRHTMLFQKTKEKGGPPEAMCSNFRNQKKVGFGEEVNLAIHYMVLFLLSEAIKIEIERERLGKL